jgi:hypothetical protein
MTHEDARDQIARLFEANERNVQRPELLEHLKGCDDCRALYDQRSLLMRRLLGKPDQMSPEELVLFEPPLPAQKVIPLFRTGPTVALALAAGLAAVVFWVTAPKDEFAARGAGPTKTSREAPSLRVLCSHEALLSDLTAHRCLEGDKLLFAVTPRGHSVVSLVIGGEVLGTKDVAPQSVDAPLPWSSTFKAGLTATAVFASAPLEAAAAQACAQGTCSAGVTAVTVGP